MGAHQRGLGPDLEASAQSLERSTRTGCSVRCPDEAGDEREVEARDLQKGGAMGSGGRPRRIKVVQDGGIRAWGVQSGRRRME